MVRKTQPTHAARPVFTLPQAELTAPVLWVDAISAFGFREGVGLATLEAVVETQDSQGNVVSERVVVAHLRFSPRGAASIGSAMEKIGLMAAPTGEAQ